MDLIPNKLNADLNQYPADGLTVKKEGGTLFLTHCI